MVLSASSALIFQSTHPSRGATRKDAKQLKAAHISIHAPLAGCDDLLKEVILMQSISIHAPLAGCDPSFAPIHAATPAFQSTHPSRGATLKVSDIDLKTRISIHVPLAGCDRVAAVGDVNAHAISIHAPLAGCDTDRRTKTCKSSYFNLRTLRGVRPGLPCNSCTPEYFNPRTPRGVRLAHLRTGLSPQVFQSTHPSRGATEPHEEAVDRSLISIHAPLAGCDRRGLYLLRPDVISIHAPLAGCDNVFYRVFRDGMISIHAPLAGCDEDVFAVKPHKILFQSTHPSRGATLEGICRADFFRISIHAPLAGCDESRAGRGGTWRRSYNFNPRTPRGVRPLP